MEEVSIKVQSLHFIYFRAERLLLINGGGALARGYVK